MQKIQLKILEHSGSLMYPLVCNYGLSYLPAYTNILCLYAQSLCCFLLVLLAGGLAL